MKLRIDSFITPICAFWYVEPKNYDRARNGIGNTKKGGKSLTNPKNKRILGVLNIK